MSKPKISIAVPTHDIPERAYFLDRLQKSLEMQTYQNFELVITDDGKMAENTNSAIKKSKGEIIKILYMDDFLYSPDALQNIVDHFKGGWLASGCVHTEDGETFTNAHFPVFDAPLLRAGMNLIGSPSVIAFENKDPMLFDEKLSWMLDLDLYIRLGKWYGPPTILPNLDVAIGLGKHQMTEKLTDDEKKEEVEYVMQKRYGTD